jgi:DnaK suppressor protein
MLSREERDQVEQRLQEERERALEALRDFDRERSSSLQEDTGELSVHRFHMADIGTEAMEREKQFLLASKEGERLYEVDEALRRLYADPDSFGICEVCGREIGMERLMVLPSTTQCAECVRAAEE